MARLKEEEEKRRIGKDWYSIAPDGYVPNSTIRSFLAKLSGKQIGGDNVQFSDIAMLIAKVNTVMVLCMSLVCLLICLLFVSTILLCCNLRMSFTCGLQILISLGLHPLHL